MLDQRDQDQVTLFSGDLEEMPSVGDAVGLFNGNVFGGWKVVSRSLALSVNDEGELQEDGAWVLILEPAEGDWDGSANDYLESLGWLDSAKWKEEENAESPRPELPAG